MILDEMARDQMIDDAAHAAEDAFAQRGVDLSEAQLFALNDYLYALLREWDAEHQGFPDMTKFAP